jgi:SAM-dependent methyltransferase
LIARIADRQPGRSEATLAADIRALLLSGSLALAPEDLRDVPLESSVEGGRRIDIEAGFAAIEVKKDLRSAHVRDGAIEQLRGYVADRTQSLGQRYVGLLTDGADWTMFHLTALGTLEEVSHLEVRASTDPAQLTSWLEGALVTRQAIKPTPDEIEGRLGAASAGHALDYRDLLSLFDTYRDEPALQLKRNLWAKLLRTTFGTGFLDEDGFFVDHTLLVVIAEIVAHAVLGFDVLTLTPRDLLSGQRFEAAQLSGVVEEDFFDWMLDVPRGDLFIRSLARRLAAFDWADVEHDVMKVLYESVIGTQQRHDLGEYYTPDWLAEEMVRQAIAAPLDKRVLDPACGSGTFLFHSVRHYLAAAERNGRSLRDSLVGVTRQVIGVDLHPVAVTLARVTYLLALGRERLSAHDRPRMAIPVYLGDSLHWGRRETLLTEGTLTIETDDQAALFASELRFPEQLLRDAGQFDRLVAELSRRATDRHPGSAVPSMSATFRRFAIRPEDQPALSQTFATMCELHDQGRDHIWGYYVRNLARPVWLATPENRVDALVGNPPWLAYRFMDSRMKQEFRSMSEARDLWAGGTVATHQDLSGLFVVRSVELYLKPGGRFAFVMPLAALSRQQFAGFRGGRYLPAVNVSFDEEPWDLDDVTPDPFPVPSAVIFGHRTSDESAAKAMPAATERWVGTLPSRNVSRVVAISQLTRESSTIQTTRGMSKSPYHDRFSQGATLAPRVLVTVEDMPAGPLGPGPGRRAVRSSRSRLEKSPWRELPSLQGTVEEQFVRPAFFGASVLPFRHNEPSLAIIPWARDRLMDGSHDELDDYPGLADWWRKAESVWNANRRNDSLSLLDRQDFRRGLRLQFPIAPHRVAYSKAGSVLVASRIENPIAVIDTTLYWAAASSVDEARYLTAILNSAELTRRVQPLQARGLFGPRHFDKYVFYVPIPVYDAGVAKHRALVDVAEEAEEIAASVDVSGRSFQSARTVVRRELAEKGVAQAIEQAVESLLT